MKINNLENSLLEKYGEEWLNSYLYHKERLNNIGKVNENIAIHIKTDLHISLPKLEELEGCVSSYDET